MINLTSVGCKKEDSQEKNIPGTPNSVSVLNKVEDINKLIVMSGSAERKPLQKKSSSELGNENGKIIQKSFFWNEIVELRPPCYKSRFKKDRTNGKFMNKSCEILFECIKPYKEVKIAEKIQTMESNQVTRSVFKMNEIFQHERKATRKVQFVSICEEGPVPFFENNQSQAMADKKSEKNFTDLDFQNSGEEKNQVNLDLFPRSKRSRKTISSYDFVNNVLPN